jgi:hypothetical protein
MIMADDNIHYIIEDANESTNIRLAYEYTESVYKARNEALDNLNGRLGTFLGFGGLLLRFAADLPGINTGCLTCLILKVIVCGFSAASIFAIATGLTSNPIGTIVKPRELMTDYWYKLSDERYRAYITNRTIGRESLPLRLLFQSILQQHSHSGLPSCAPSSLPTSTIYGAQIQAYPC